MAATKTWEENSDVTTMASGTVWVSDGVIQYARQLRAGETVEEALADFRGSYDHGDRCDGDHDPVVSYGTV